MKSRKDRRSGMPLENPFVFYARYAASEIRNVSSMLWTYRRLRRSLDAIWKDPHRFEYRDVAITPPDLDELSLGLYAETRGTAAAIEKQKRQQEIVRKAQARRDEVPLVAAE